jgi:bifunctional non-homologous end joining protein LigD
MLIRKNTKAFKTILEIVSKCQNRDDREKLIRLYITKAGHTIQDRISVEGIQGETALFYEMNYQSVLNNLQSSNHQLQVSDEIPGIYFFHSTSNKMWDETPFEFDEAIKKEFNSLPDLPMVRKKEKPEKFVFPTGKSEAAPPKSKPKKVKATKKADVKLPETKTKQPDFKLKHTIDFTNLEKIIFRKSKVEKKDILEYYNKIAPHILPYLKDRFLWTRRYLTDIAPLEEMSVEGLFGEFIENVPAWIPTKSTSRAKGENEMLLCQDREQLLFYVENGCLQFDPCLSKTKSLHSPDYMILVVESPEYELAPAIEIALRTKEVLDGLQLPSYVKTDGMSGMHIYIPLDSKVKFEVSKDAAAYICKLIRLKIPDLITLKESDENGYRKVSLDYSFNEEGKGVVAPYSLVPGESPVVATPLLWDEIREDLHAEDFNHNTIFKRLKQVGDPFEGLFKKKVDADILLDRLEKNYGFLFT